MNRKRELILFFVLAHGFSWLVFVPLVIFHGPLQWVILATFGPTFAALVTNRIVAGELPGISCLYIMGADHGRHCPWSRPHRICLRCASRSNDSRPSKAEVEHFNLTDGIQLFDPSGWAPRRGAGLERLRASTAGARVWAAAWHRVAGDPLDGLALAYVLVQS